MSRRRRILGKAKPADKRLSIVEEVLDGYHARFEHLFLIHTIALERDARFWDHVSVSRADRQMPTYEDLQLAKALCLGDKRAAIELFPKASEHIDIAGNMPNPKQVRHLWSCKKMPLPDFTDGGRGL